MVASRLSEGRDQGVSHPDSNLVENDMKILLAESFSGCNAALHVNDDLVHRPSHRLRILLIEYTRFGIKFRN
jgi:hypothetical protein